MKGSSTAITSASFASRLWTFRPRQARSTGLFSRSAAEGGTATENPVARAQSRTKSPQPRRKTRLCAWKVAKSQRRREARERPPLGRARTSCSRPARRRTHRRPAVALYAVADHCEPQLRVATTVSAARAADRFVYFERRRRPPAAARAPPNPSPPRRGALRCRRSL